MIWLLFFFIYCPHSVLSNVYTEDGRRFRCPLDPLTDRYADPTDPTCRRYFLCHLGHAHPSRCDVRRAFHPQLKQCYPRYQIPDSVCMHPVDCDKNGYLSDPDDCTKYYICFFRQAIHYACLVGYVFDPKKSLCIKDKKKAQSCEKPKGRDEPDAQHHTFQRDRYPIAGNVKKGPNPDDGNYVDMNSNLPVVPGTAPTPDSLKAKTDVAADEEYVGGE